MELIGKGKMHEIIVLKTHGLAYICGTVGETAHTPTENIILHMPSVPGVEPEIFLF